MNAVQHDIAQLLDVQLRLFLQFLEEEIVSVRNARFGGWRNFAFEKRDVTRLIAVFRGRQKLEARLAFAQRIEQHHLQMHGDFGMRLAANLAQRVNQQRQRCQALLPIDQLERGHDAVVHSVADDNQRTQKMFRRLRFRVLVVSPQNVVQQGLPLFFVPRIFALKMAARNARCYSRPATSGSYRLLCETF